MKASKRIILLAAFVMLTHAVHAQRFERARAIYGYDQSSSDVGNKIAGSMTDSDGNPFTSADRLHPEDSLKILVDENFAPNALTPPPAAKATLSAC